MRWFIVRDYELDRGVLAYGVIFSPLRVAFAASVDFRWGFEARVEFGPLTAYFSWEPTR